MHLYLNLSLCLNLSVYESICPYQFLYRVYYKKESRLGNVFLINKFSDLAQLCSQKLFPVGKIAKANRFKDTPFSICYLMLRMETML